jgi:hypothetical protein
MMVSPGWLKEGALSSLDGAMQRKIRENWSKTEKIELWQNKTRVPPFYMHNERVTR